MTPLKKVKFRNCENFININEAYSNFIQKLTSVIDEIAPCKNLNITTKFQLKPTTEDIVLKPLKNIDISKAAGVDNLPGRFLKDGAVILAKPVTEICNFSIKSKIFPDPCKLVKLKSIFKIGSRIDPSNYRPILLLPLISKIFEKIVHDQMIGYLAQCNILYKYQSGFRTKYSTDLCLSYLNDKILKGFDSGLFTGVIRLIRSTIIYFWKN